MALIFSSYGSPVLVSTIMLPNRAKFDGGPSGPATFCESIVGACAVAALMSALWADGFVSYSHRGNGEKLSSNN